MSDELTLEKLRIVQKMGEIEKSIIELSGSVRLNNKTVEGIDKTLHLHSREIWGYNDTPGLKTKLDRINQREKMITFPYVLYPITIASSAFIGFVISRWYYLKEYQRRKLINSNVNIADALYKVFGDFLNRPIKKAK